MRANPRLSKALDSLTQKHYVTAKAESPCSLWLMPSCCADEPLNLCLAQHIFIPTSVQLLKVKWMHNPTPSYSSLANESFDGIFTGELFALFPSRNQYRERCRRSHGSKARLSSTLHQHAADTFELSAHSTGHSTQCLF